MEKKLYEHRLLEATKNVLHRDAAKNAVHLHKYDMEMLRQTHETMVHHQQIAQAEADYRTHQRDVRVEKRREAKAAYEEGLTRDMQAWQLNQDVSVSRAQAKLRFELSVNKRAQQKDWAVRTTAQMEVDGGLAEFERNAQRLGIPIPALTKTGAAGAGSKPSSAAQGTRPAGGAAAGDDDDDQGGTSNLTLAERQNLDATGKLDPLQHLTYLATRLPDVKTQNRLAGEHLAHIKEKTLADIKARDERERRRRKVLVDQQAASAEADEKRKQQQLLDLLAKTSAAERQVAENVWRAQQFKLIMKENRAYRDTQVQQQTDAYMRTAVARDREIYYAQRREAEVR